LTGTLDLSIAPADISSTYRRQVATYTGPTLYVAGGDPISADDVRMGILFTVLGTITNGTNVLVIAWDALNNALMLFDNSTGAEFAGDASGYLGNLEFIGR